MMKTFLLLLFSVYFFFPLVSQIFFALAINGRVWDRYQHRSNGAHASAKCSKHSLKLFRCDSEVSCARHQQNSSSLLRQTNSTAW